MPALKQVILDSETLLQRARDLFLRFDLYWYRGITFACSALAAAFRTSLPLSPEEYRSSVLQKAAELGIPVEKHIP